MPEAEPLAATIVTVGKDEPYPTRTPYVLNLAAIHVLQDLTDAEIAQLLECSVGTVRSHASRALAALRLDDSLNPQGGADLTEVKR